MSKSYQQRPSEHHGPPEPKLTPPKIATFLIEQCSPVHSRECLLGDLFEEFYDKAEVNMSNATHWYWKQSINTALHYLSQSLVSEKFLRFFVIFISTILLLSLLITISWMSNMDTVQPALWAQLLRGEVHNFMFNASVLSFGAEKIINDFDIWMYQNGPGFYWLLFSSAILFLRDKLELMSAHKLAAWGYTLMFLPYIFGLIYIEFMQPEPTKVGPTIAFMLFSIVYMLLPIGYWVVKRTRNRGN